ncbi:hypothetical protein WR25_14053 [Diploscapter pachys]|uniref:Uncharacterized protein n=1 Tax=Diploscapter pachys TaxID=2018661 RepID=A0A2A2M3T8_9BILA|nr:hypothetical protein WR25_14053 [Diploscapter pachys]
MCTCHALAASGTETQQRREAGIDVMQLLQGDQQLLTAGVASDLLQGFDQQLPGAQGTDLQRRLAWLQPLAQLHPGKGRPALRGPVAGTCAASACSAPAYTTRKAAGARPRASRACSATLSNCPGTPGKGSNTCPLPPLRGVAPISGRPARSSWRLSSSGARGATRANTRSRCISVSNACAVLTGSCPGSSATSCRRRPWIPPCWFNCATPSSSTARTVRPASASGPCSGSKVPRRKVPSSTPGSRSSPRRLR